MVSDRFQPDTANLERLFGGSSPKLRVPMYQRRFAWNHNQEIQELLEDIKNAKLQDVGDYFLGTIVLNRAASEELEVIDGQQRLASLTMLLAAIRNHLTPLAAHSHEASAASNNLNGYINRTDLRGRPLDPVLTLGPYDKESFNRYVQLRPGEPSHLALDASLPQSRPGRPRHNKIREAFRQITSAIGELIKGCGPDEQIERLASLADFVLHRLTHITITVADDVDAFTLFETVNYRGLDLSTADLLKNHLFGLVSHSGSTQDQIGELNTQWESIMATLEGQEITRFLRYYWLSRFSHITAKDLYGQIKQWLRVEQVTPIDFLVELNDQAVMFDSLVNPKDADPCALELRDLRDMRMTQGLPLLMAAKEECDDSAFKRFVNLVESLAIRNTLVGKRNPNELERNFGTWARRLRTDKNLSLIYDEASNLCVSDDEFMEGFQELSDLSIPQARYILRKIEWSGNQETQLASTGVEVEHILPQSVDPSWKTYFGESEEDLGDARQRLGNLTLLDGKLNKSAAAKLFDEKKDRYRSSNISMTRDLADLPGWSYQTIVDRQKNFAEKAKSIWNVPT